MKIRLRTLLAFAVAVLLCGLAQAQERFPSRPIRMIVPFGAGGGTDIVARTIAQKLSEQIAVPVVVENRPGANGNIAGQEVSKAPADGYTLLYNTSSLAISPSLYKNLAYDARTDLAPVIHTAELPLVLVVNPAVPAADLKEFVAYLNANPGKVFYGSAGNGNISHLAAAQFLQASAMTAVHVPFKAGGPALMATVSGDVQFYFDTVNSAAALIKSGKLKALGISTLNRATSLPGVPTFSEGLLPGFNVPVWQGIVAPAKTPRAIISRLNEELNAVLKDKDVLAKLAVQDTMAVGSTPEQYGAFLKSEIERWANVVKVANVKIE